MDKTHPQYPISTYRRGFALMITLSVLSVVIVLSVVMLSYFKEVKEDADTTKALIQANIYYADILDQFNKIKGKIGRLYRMPISLRTPDGRFKIMLRCSPLSDGVNINWLAMEKEHKKQHLFQEAQRLFDALVQEYDLEEPDRLLEMILSEIALGQKFVRHEQSRLIQKNGIISHQQFYSILSRYEMEVDDPKVGRIPWRKYFSFSRKSEKIEVEYSSSELISFLFDIDLKSVREWKALLARPSLESFVNENAGNYNEKKKLLAGGTFLGESHCSVNFGAGYKFTFDYIQGEAKYFEFYGQH